ncbi:unnamed protein product, partial [Symbiodinium sp. KB8]
EEPSQVEERDDSLDGALLQSLPPKEGTGQEDAASSPDAQAGAGHPDGAALEEASQDRGGTASAASDSESASSGDDSSSEEETDDEFEVPVRSHGAWDAFVDEETREEYYYNRETDETTWEPPIPEIMPPHLAALEFLSKLMSNPYDPEQPHPLSSFGLWSVYVDHESMSMYYCNDETGETSWDPPEDWDEKLASIPPLAILTEDPDDPDEAAFLKLVSKDADGGEGRPICVATAREPETPGGTARSGGAPSEPSEPSGPDPSKVWFVYRDIESLMQYFVNSKTGESRWEPPAAIADKVVQDESATIQPGEWEKYLSSDSDAKDDVVARVNGWEVYQDRKSGRWYYFNPDSGETCWDAPPAVMAAAPEDWEAGGATMDASGNVLDDSSSDVQDESEDSLPASAMEASSPPSRTETAQGASPRLDSVPVPEDHEEEDGLLALG